MDKKDIEEKNKLLVKKIKEDMKFEDSLKIKPTVLGRIWFTLTCLRPVTKIELARTAQAIVQNRRLLNQMVIQMNGLTIKLSEIVGYLHGVKDIKNVNDIKDPLEKEHKKRAERKDTGMYN